MLTIPQRKTKNPKAINLTLKSEKFKLDKKFCIFFADILQLQNKWFEIIFISSIFEMLEKGAKATFEYHKSRWIGYTDL